MPVTSIDKFSTIDESNYLIVDFRDQLNTQSNNRYKTEVERLWEMGRALELVELDGLMDKSGGVQTYYLEAMRWIKGQTNTTNWVNIAPLPSSDQASRNSLIDQFFQQWIVNFSNTFFAQPLLIGYFASLKHPRPADLSKQQQNLIESFSNNMIKSIQSVSEDEQNKIIKASSLKEWQFYFDDLVKKLPNDKWSPIFVPPMSIGFGNGRKNRKQELNKGNYFYLQQHYKSWKTIWLISFAVSIIGTFTINEIWLGYPFLKILPVKIALGVFFGILYESANKNYRIYSNLLDQTRYRALVAKTIQSIILDDDRFDPDQKKILFAVAAQTLFEMRTSGHLTKKDSVSPASELLTAFITGRAQP